MSYIADYLKTTENSKPPLEYHVWAMLSTLSAFAGRRFRFPFGPMYFYTNLYVVLVGEPGFGKSTAMNRAKNIVRASEVCPVAATQITKEALTLTMANDKFPGRKTFVLGDRTIEYNQYSIFATELTQFIGVNPIGFLDFLTTVWDEPVYQVETKNKGNDLIVGPYITMLACMTPEIVKGFLKMNILTGGFARRTAFMHCSHKNIIHIPSYTHEQQEAELRCIKFGQALQYKHGDFDWSDELKDFYIAWNQSNEEVMRDRPPATRGWYESKGEMLFKISMLVALAEDCGNNLILNVAHYKTALRFCSYVEKTLERVFEGTGQNPNAMAAAQICRMLEAMDRPMNKKAIEAMFFDQVTNLNDLRDTMTHLVSVGRLAERTLFVDNTILGTLIATPATIGRYTDLQLAAFLKKPVALPQQETGEDSTT